MKKYNKKNILLITAGMIFGGLFLLFVMNKIFIYKIESNIEKNMKGYSFNENSQLKGFSVDYEKLNCSGLFNYECSISNFSLIMNLKSKKVPFLTAKETILIPKSYTQPLVLDINFKNIDMQKNMKENFFRKYNEFEYKKIGESLESMFFPFNLHLDLNVVKKSKDIAEGTFSYSISNNISDIFLTTDIYISNKPYSENIKIKKEVSKKDKDVELETELKVKNIPYFAKIDNIKYIIENKKFKELFYQIYLLSGKNIENLNGDISRYNYYYLEVSDNQLVSYNVFEKNFVKMLGEYGKSIPDEEKTYKNIIENIYLLFKENKKKLIIEAKNKNNTSIEKTGILFFIDKFNTTRRYLDESFDTKIEIK